MARGQITGPKTLRRIPKIRIEATARAKRTPRARPVIAAQMIRACLGVGGGMLMVHPIRGLFFLSEFFRSFGSSSDSTEEGGAGRMGFQDFKARNGCPCWTGDHILELSGVEVHLGDQFGGPLNSLTSEP